MGQIKRHQPVKLITGFIFKNKSALNKVEILLQKQFGRIDFNSSILPFCHTDYYAGEFGKDLKRRFIAFNKLIQPSDLPEIKIITNKIEKRLSKGLNRTINIDPGYLDLSKLVLASTKDYRHRIYLNNGIYAEVTLFYQSKTFLPWEWTYPDYKTSEYISIFNQIRQIYAEQIKAD